MVTIEKNVPLLRRRNPLTQAVWEAMQKCEVGDSFLISGPHRHKAVAVFISRNQLLLGRRFTVWKEGEGARAWRIE